jgi:hypothetical protein
MDVVPRVILYVVEASKLPENFRVRSVMALSPLFTR